MSEWKKVSLKIPPPIFADLKYLMKKWETNQSQTIRLCILYQFFSEKSKTIDNYISQVSQMKEALANGS